MKLLLLILQFIARIFSVSVDVSNSSCPNTPRRKVSFRKVSHKEIDKVKDYADVFGIDNSMHASVEDLMTMGIALEGYMGEDQFEALKERVRLRFIASQTKDKSSGNSVLNAILQWAERIIVQLHVVKLHIKGGDKDVEGTING